MRRALQHPSKAKLVIAVLWQPQVDLEFLDLSLEKVFGKIVERSEVFKFTQSTYYKTEMGESLTKCFLVFEGLHARDKLSEFKLKTVALEEKFLFEDKRRVNLDPMIVTLENVIISTTKNFPHRIYLGHGVYGDLGLIRRRNGFEGLPWSYLDYLEQIPFFEMVHSGIKREMNLASS